ncbi:LrgB family protein [Youngiibacter multivorans]|uniref:Murein hydrolase (TIGR00659 family) n=1 Tax=Youngiibacter multivorans TaxID=937251 RepID=A0ABS4G5Z9_9CLOT|nr:LrgB family protein [Youngiibacter multivorans]MBP1919981.1 putative murein hydrolase (TIGR00659 family) [Youngiibacter multivorans]
MIDRLFALTKSPLFGLAISFLAYRIGVYVFKRVRNPLLSPLVVSTAIVIFVLVALKVPVENYSAGGAMLSFMLGPSVIVLSVPLYRNFELLKSHYVAILTGIFAGTLASITSILLFSKLLGIDRAIIVSMIPKSVTTAIGLEISKELGGIVPITVVSIFVTGTLGAIMVPLVMKAARLKDPVAKGVAIGTAAHALGTAKAVEMGETEGAMSGLSIGIAGLITVVLAPLLLALSGI